MPATAARTAGPTGAIAPPEKAVALDVALRVDRKLRESQLKTVLTRANDTFIPLDNRVAIGNEQKNSIFVSIHFNDSRRRGVEGVETYYHSPYAFDLAAAIERNLSTLPGNGESRRPYGRLPGPAQRPLPICPRGMRIPQQPLRSARRGRRRVSRKAGGQNRRSDRRLPLRHRECIAVRRPWSRAPAAARRSSPASARTPFRALRARSRRGE